MPKFAGAVVLQNGPQLIITRAGTANRVRLHLLSSYTLAQSYATVLANSLGAVSLVGGDLGLAANGNNQRLTVGAKTLPVSVTAAAGDRHVAVLDEVSSEVLLVTDETTDQAVTAGNNFSVPAFTYDVQQPV
jgi:hypothetical protein